MTGASAQGPTRAPWPGGTLVALVTLRFLGFLGTIAGAVGLVLVLMTLAPGDPIDLLPNAEEVRPILEVEWRLDRPLPERWVRSLGRLATADLGTSLAYRPGVPVLDLVAGPALRSAGWLTASLGLAMTWGTGLALLTARRRATARLLVQWVSITPVFLLAHLAVTGLNEGAYLLMQGGWIERPEWFALPDQPSALRTVLAVVLLAVGSGTLAEVHQAVEAALAEILRSGYADAARARGAPVWPHVVRNLAGPLASIAATRAATLVGGLVVLEKVLFLNGAGAILWQAAELRDYDLATGVALLAAIWVAGLRAAGDALRVTLDPRLRTVGSS